MMRFVPILMFLIISCASGFGQGQDSVKYVSAGPAEFQKALKGDPRALLVDVREFFEYRKQRIDHAVNIPSSGNIAWAADSIPKETPLFLYCTTGFRSKRTAARFCEMGFSEVYSLDGGIKAWKKSGLPVSREKIKRKKAGLR